MSAACAAVARPRPRAPSAPAGVVAARGADRCSRRRCACDARPSRASGTTRRSRPCTCCTRPRRDAATRSSHTENTPPLWYLLAWVDARLLGDGALALRLPSALAGIAHVPVVWAIGTRARRPPRGADRGAALVAVNPLFVWYSQEARAYGLFVLHAGARDALLRARCCASRRAARMAAVRAHRRAGAADATTSPCSCSCRWRCGCCASAPRAGASLPRDRRRSRSSAWRCCR